MDYLIKIQEEINSRLRWMIWSALLLVNAPLSGQKNLAPNPGFEEPLNCDFGYGEADKVFPWQIANAPLATPDLFHTCSTSPGFQPPVGCWPVYPRSGDGMIGLAQLEEEERIYARLVENLPLDMDIYVAYAYLPQQKCGGEFDVLCYSNTQGLAFTDIELRSQQIVIESDTIMDYTEDWRMAETCFRANGSERYILLGNVKSDRDVLRDCDYTDAGINYAYFFIDDIIVSPFDVVPDTLFICGEEVLEVDATFYDVPIEWSDGQQGAKRTIDQPGRYTVRGVLEDCVMRDETVVVKIPDETEVFTLDLCTEGSLDLEAPFPALWENGDTSKVLTVFSAGTYLARLFSTCGERTRRYVVTEKDCQIDYFVPTAFSPNGDGINDQLEFFFSSDFGFTGQLRVYDRWGNQVFLAKDVDERNAVSWNGSSKEKPLPPGVYVWSFRYSSTNDEQIYTLFGETTLVR
jgi:gliding motility-associated-like protein